MSALLEKAARALKAEIGEKTAYNEGRREYVTDWEAGVRAVLEAIREPDEAMVEAGMDYDEREIELRLGRPPTVEECQIGEWCAMLDALLSPS